jgi:hypothetical protein
MVDTYKRARQRKLKRPDSRPLGMLAPDPELVEE